MFASHFPEMTCNRISSILTLATPVAPDAPDQMTNAERFKLLYGPYRTPKVSIGTVLTCESRDCDVIVVGYTDARIPWPVGRQRGRAARGPVVYGELAEAVRRESGIAICYWWGVTGQTATKWRKALGVEQYTDGTRRLKRDYFKEPWARNAQRKGWAKARDPERCAKIAAAKKGKPHSGTHREVAEGTPGQTSVNRN